MATSASKYFISVRDVVHVLLNVCSTKDSHNYAFYLIIMTNIIKLNNYMELEVYN